MTDKQIERVKIKIRKLKQALADDKKHWGGAYHDGSGIRYVIPQQYIKIKDYKGGLRYLRWFDKAFPDDIGYPIFLFESVFILFKSGKLQEAEKKAHRTFFSNTYLFDIFLEKEPLYFDKNENHAWEFQELAKHLTYKKDDLEFVEFAAWIEKILNSREFLDKANEFIQLEQELKNEPVGKKRTELVERLSKIKYT